MNCSSRCYSIIWTLVQPSLRITDCRHHFLYGNKYTVDLNISQRRQIKLLSHLAKPAWYKRGTRSNAASSGRTQESTWQSLIANLQVSAACLPNTAVWWWVQWRCERTVVDSLSWQGDLVTLTFWLCWVTYKKKKKTHPGGTGFNLQPRLQFISRPISCDQSQCSSLQLIRDPFPPIRAADHSRQFASCTYLVEVVRTLPVSSKGLV